MYINNDFGLSPILISPSTGTGIAAAVHVDVLTFQPAIQALHLIATVMLCLRHRQITHMVLNFMEQQQYQMSSFKIPTEMDGLEKGVANVTN